MKEMATVYTLQNCPKCEIAKRMLLDRDYEIEVLDLKDPSILSEVSLEMEDRGQLAPKSAPVIYLDELDSFLTYKDFCQFIERS